MSETPRWLEDARISERMHAQGLPLDMMLSVDRGSDAVVLRVTTRHLTRAEARELGSRLIEGALLAGERDSYADGRVERPS
jgi:adenylate kinase family enzyme